MNARSALSLALVLTATLPLAGCEDIDDFFRLWSGQPSKAEMRHRAAASVTAAYVVPPAATPTPEVTPETPPPVVAPEPAPPVVTPTPEPEPSPPAFECVTIFRIQTCEAGVLYQLDSNMAWILPGRTE